MEKINLSEFKENSLAINEMLHTSGGSSDSSGTVHCQTDAMAVMQITKHVM